MAEKNFNLIQLYAEQHAIEVANFVIILSQPIDHADVRRFDEQKSQIIEHFPAINSPEVFEIAIGNSPPPPSLPQPVPVKDLNYFGNDGKPQWSGFLVITELSYRVENIQNGKKFGLKENKGLKHSSTALTHINKSIQ